MGVQVTVSPDTKEVTSMFPLLRPLIIISVCASFYADLRPAACHPSHTCIKQFNNKWAVVIGVTKFIDKSWDLTHSAQDAAKFRKYLIDRVGIPSSHVKCLQNSEATHANVLSAIDWLKSSTQPDDLAVLYIRTRGTYPRSKQIQKNYLATADTSPDSIDENGLEMQSFVHFLNSKFPDTTLATIIDADFSDAISDFYGTSMEERKRNGKPLLFVCSCNSNELSWDSPKTKSGIFTGALLFQLRRRGKGCPLLQTAIETQPIVDKNLRRIRKHRTQTVNTLAIVCGSSHLDVVLDFDSRFQERVARPKNSQ